MRLATRNWGEEGRPLAVLVHGVSASSRTWWRVGPWFAEKGWHAVATRFEDRVTVFPEIGRDEAWRLINLTGDTHPIHVHLVSFQALARYGVTCEIPPGSVTETETTAEVRFGAPADDTVVHELDANQQGLKDTIRVNLNEVLDIALRFTPYAGRFMYHCHILEHEDRDMMRPIVVTPKEVMDSMSMPGMNGSDQRM